MNRQVGIVVAVVSVVAGLTVGGCAGINLLDSHRLEVNDRLREACPDMSDLQIEQELNGEEVARELGMSVAAEKSFLSLKCKDDAACWTCGVAIINQVYGE